MTPADEPLLPHSTSEDGDDETESFQSQSLVSKTWTESKKIWRIAIPSAIARLAMFSLTVITQSFAGHLGNHNLAAISIATTVIISITFGFLCIWLVPSFLDWISKRAFHGLWEFLKLSFASGVMLSLENFYYRVLIIVSGILKHDEVAVDALSICVTIYGWESTIALGFFAAAGVRVANELGAKRKEGAKFTTIVSLLNSLIVGTLFSSLVMVFPDKFAKIFTSSGSVIKMVHELSSFLALTIFVNCIQSILSGVAVGYGWQALVAFVNIGSYYVVGMPIGIFLGWFLNFGIQGIWAGMIVGTMVQILILVIITVKL